MNLMQLDRGTNELVESLNKLRNKMHNFLESDPEESKVIYKLMKDLENVQKEATFLAIMAEHLHSVELDRQQLLLENDMLRDELKCIKDKLKIVDLHAFSLEEQQRQDQFDTEMRALDEMLEMDLKFSGADVSTFMREEEVIDVSSENIDAVIPMRTKTAATYFTKYLNEGNFDVAVSTCERFIKEFESDNHSDRLELAAMLEIQAMAFRNDSKLKEAANMLKKTLTIYDAMLPVDNPLILITLKNLAQLYEMIDRDFSNHTDGRDFSNQLMNMANTCENLCNFDSAVKLYRQVLDIYEKMSVNVSSSTSKMLAIDSVHQAQFQKAKTYENNVILTPAVETRPNQQNNKKSQNCISQNCISQCSCDSCESLEREERALMLSDLVLENLPEMPFNNKKEDLKDVVCKIGRALDVTMNKEDIRTCYRVGRADEKNYRRSVIVTFKVKTIRDAVYYAYLKKRYLMIKDVFHGSNSEVRVYISERLTAACKQLYRRCSVLKKQKIIDRFFTKNGRLYLQKLFNFDSEVVTPELLKSLENKI